MTSKGLQPSRRPISRNEQLENIVSLGDAGRKQDALALTSSRLLHVETRFRTPTQVSV